MISLTDIPHIFQINISDGGVPKTAISCARVDAGGIDGDRQRNIQVHGGPDRALCLFSLEGILELQKEGHPIFPGSVGENITTVGIPHENLRPGLRMTLGSQVLIEIVSYAQPCSTIGASFIDGRSDRISPTDNPGWARVYARVLQSGEIRPGDRLEIHVPIPA